MNDAPIIPPNWQNLWSPEAVTFLKPLIRSIRYAFNERDHDAFFQLWTPGANARGSFVSCGIRKQGLQKNGNNYASLFAFGFFYETAFTWPAGYVDHFADRAVLAYSDFLEQGDIPANAIRDVHTDDAALKRNANLSAPVARRTNAHLDLPGVKKIVPHKMAVKSIAALNRQMKLAIDEGTDMWGEPLEVDPLS